MNRDSNPMQIGMMTYALDHVPRGMARYTQELIEALQRNDMVVTRLHGGRKPQAIKNEMAVPGSRLLPALLTLRQVEMGWVGKRHNLSLIHDPVGGRGAGVPMMPLCLFFTGSRRVATIHDLAPYIYAPEWRGDERSSKVDKFIYHYWLPLVVRRLDAIITVSTQSKEDIIRYLPVKSEDIVVIPQAASESYRLLNRTEVKSVLTRYNIDFPYILYVGSLESRKNLARLLEAYARVRQKVPQWKLVLVGADKWKVTPIFETIQRLQLEPHVHFTGYVEEEDLPAIYNGADLFVFPSLYEGFGLPVLEAMGCGTPVMTSDCSALPEVAGDAALLIDPYDVEAMAEVIEQVLLNPTLAASLRVKGLARAKKFSWERTARETIAVYQKVLDS